MGEFKKDMSEDYTKRFGYIIGMKKVYNYIVNMLQIEGSILLIFLKYNKSQRNN